MPIDQTPELMGDLELHVFIQIGICQQTEVKTHQHVQTLAIGERGNQSCDKWMSSDSSKSLILISNMLDLFQLDHCHKKRSLESQTEFGLGDLTIRFTENL
jgi:hypothetical protein